MSGAPLRVAVLGAGTVGREVVCALLERADELRPSDGAALVLTGIGVRDVERAVGPRASRPNSSAMRPPISWPTTRPTSSSS